MGLFSKLAALSLAAGRLYTDSLYMEGWLWLAVGLRRMTDQYQVEVVQARGAVEDVVVRLSTVEGCGRVLEWISDSSESGLVFRLVANARSAATARFMAQRK